MTPSSTTDNIHSSASSLLSPPHSHQFSSPNSPNEPSSPNSCFDGGEYFLEREAQRNDRGMIDFDNEANASPAEAKHTIIVRGREVEVGTGRKDIFDEDGLIMVDFDGFRRGRVSLRRDAVDGEGNGQNGKIPDQTVKIEEETLQPIPDTRKRRVRFAPLRVPLSRRLQTLAVLFHITALSLFLILFYSSTANPFLWPLIIIYLIHLLFSNSHHNGSSPYVRSPHLRTLKLWRWYNEYFPIRIHRTVKLDPECNYIFGYSPHGIISFGAWGAFVTDSSAPRVDPSVTQEFETIGGELNILSEAAERTARPGYKCALGGGFKKLFPGITTTLLTLDGNFKIPIYREYLLAMGLASVSRRSCEALLGIPPSPNASSSPSSTSILFAERYPALSYLASLNDKKLQKPPRHSRKSLFKSDYTSVEIPTNGENLRHFLSFLNPFSWASFCFNILLALLIPVIPPTLLERYLRKRHPHIPSELPSPRKGGHSITIVIGGARESLLAHPGHLNLIVRRRQGFIKLALRSNMNGTATGIVPCLAFGENDVYSTLTPEKKDGQEPRLVKVQMFVKKLLGFTMPVFWARGVFNYDVGLVPFRNRIEVVVGRPVFPPDDWRERKEEEVVKELSEQYEKELKRIWEEWKDVFARERKEELEIAG